MATSVETTGDPPVTPHDADFHPTDDPLAADLQPSKRLSMVAPEIKVLLDALLADRLELTEATGLAEAWQHLPDDPEALESLEAMRSLRKRMEVRYADLCRAITTHLTRDAADAAATAATELLDRRNREWMSVVGASPKIDFVAAALAEPVGCLGDIRYWIERRGDDEATGEYRAALERTVAEIDRMTGTITDLGRELQRTSALARNGAIA